MAGNAQINDLINKLATIGNQGADTKLSYYRYMNCNSGHFNHHPHPHEVWEDLEQNDNVNQQILAHQAMEFALPPSLTK